MPKEEFPQNRETGSEEPDFKIGDRVIVKSPIKITDGIHGAFFPEGTCGTVIEVDTEEKLFKILFKNGAVFWIYGTFLKICQL